jgi:hypothetical protein
MRSFVVSGQKNKDLIRLRGYETFQAKRIIISPVWGILNRAGKKNKDLSSLCGVLSF